MGAWNVHTRHQLITRAALTVFKEETEALELLIQLSWAMPLMVYSTSFLHTLMMVLYQSWLHPWRRILAKEETPVDAQSPTNEQLLQDPEHFDEEEEMPGDDQEMSEEPEHSSEMEMAELHGPAQGNGQESMIA